MRAKKRWLKEVTVSNRGAEFQRVEKRASAAAPVRVAHLITGLGVGGAETMLVNLLGKIDLQRFPAVVISLLPLGPLASRIEAAGVEVRSLGLGRGSLDIKAIPRLLVMLREFSPRILQCWMYHADVLGVLAGKAARVDKVVWNIRCSDLDIPHAPLSLRAVFTAHALGSRFADVAIANSRAGLDFHERHGHHPKRWSLIRNGFDVARFAPSAERRRDIRAELGIDEDQVVIGMVARYDDFKDHATFCSAAEILRRREPRARFVLVGRGATWDNGSFAKLVDRHGLRTAVHLLGEHPDPARVLPGFDISTLCSLSEGFPNAVGEAMSAGLPCVATDVGDARELLEDVGVVVPPRDPDAVASAWARLISAGADARSAMGNEARARIVRQYSLTAVVGEYERLYSGLAHE